MQNNKPNNNKGPEASVTRMTRETELELLNLQRECTFMWVNSLGEPFGVVMSYLTLDGKLWLNTEGDNARIRSLRRSPRAAVSINSSGTPFGPGKTLSYKGQCTIHTDRVTKDWFFSELSSTLMPDNKQAASAYCTFLDSPGKVIIEFEPDYRLGFDASSMSVIQNAKESKAASDK